MKIEINEGLSRRLKAFLNESSFKNLDELVEYVLDDYLQNNAEKAEKTDQEILEERLKNLGYL